MVQFNLSYVCRYITYSLGAIRRLAVETGTAACRKVLTLVDIGTPYQ